MTERLTDEELTLKLMMRCGVELYAVMRAAPNFYMWDRWQTALGLNYVMGALAADLALDDEDKAKMEPFIDAHANLAKIMARLMFDDTIRKGNPNDPSDTHVHDRPRHAELPAQNVSTPRKKGPSFRGNGRHARGDRQT